MRGASADDKGQPYNAGSNCDLDKTRWETGTQHALRSIESYSRQGRTCVALGAVVLANRQLVRAVVREAIVVEIELVRWVEPACRRNFKSILAGEGEADVPAWGMNRGSFSPANNRHSWHHAQARSSPQVLIKLQRSSSTKTHDCPIGNCAWLLITSSTKGCVSP